MGIFFCYEEMLSYFRGLFITVFSFKMISLFLYDLWMSVAWQTVGDEFQTLQQLQIIRYITHIIQIDE